MSSDEPTSTSASLLASLVRPGEHEESWQRFCDRYRPSILRWCRGQGLQPADAEDITQNVLLRLSQRLPTYRREKGRFRSWLRRVVINAVHDYRRAVAREVAKRGGQSSMLVILESLPDHSLAEMAIELSGRITATLQLLEEACRLAVTRPD